MTHIERLKTLTMLFSSQRFEKAAIEALSQNDRFNRESVNLAIEAILTQMIFEDKLHQWLSRYDIPDEVPELTVGVVMAGNIPLVGFFDLLCVLIVGHRAQVKLSSKDDAMMRCVIEQLCQVGYQVEIVSQVRDVDRLIATGSDTTKDFFENAFRDIPTLVRGSRTSIAVLGNTLCPEQASALLLDMFSHGGYGCRNVSRLLLPRGFDLDQLPEYHPNDDLFRYDRAMAVIGGLDFVERGGYVLLHDDSQILTNTHVTTILYQFYDNMNHVTEYIDRNDRRIQCVVSDLEFRHARVVKLGKSQFPELWDYADSVDVIRFLL